MKSNKIQYSKGFFTVNGEVRTETKSQQDLRKNTIANTLSAKFKVTKTKR